MKVIALEANYGAGEGAMPKISILADSALQKSGRPLFLPDWAERFACREHIVVRVGRLGKNIAERFAMRYIDAATAGFIVEAEGAEPAIATSWDGAALIGDFVDINSLDVNNIELASFNKGEELHRLNSGNMTCKIAKIVEYVSKYFTLKNGDLIYTGFAYPATALAIDDRLTATINGTEVINNKIK